MQCTSCVRHSQSKATCDTARECACAKARTQRRQRLVVQSLVTRCEENELAICSTWQACGTGATNRQRCVCVIPVKESCDTYSGTACTPLRRLASAHRRIARQVRPQKWQCRRRRSWTRDVHIGRTNSWLLAAADWRLQEAPPLGDDGLRDFCGRGRVDCTRRRPVARRGARGGGKRSGAATFHVW